MTRLLVSVRDVAEALLAAEHGADLVDCKEPSAGALGALPTETIAAVVRAVRARFPGRALSATVGDFAPDAVDPVLERVAAVAATGVDYVKVGVSPGAFALLDALRACDAAIVPVFIADAGLDAALLERACAVPFPALMLDTADKAAGSLFDVLDGPTLRRFVHAAHAAGRWSGLAGALRLEHAARVAALGADFAGFRTAACAGRRTGMLDGGRVQALRAALQVEAAAAA